MEISVEKKPFFRLLTLKKIRYIFMIVVQYEELRGKTMTENTFLVPDFYMDFKCKCAACRACCCEGWTVSVAMSEYFSLLSLECGESLRAKLNTCFYIPRDSSPERYAILKHDYEGNCPLRAENGLCRLQTEMGENNLPLICKVYPRSIRADLGEATLSTSCEGVIEMLINRTEPISFTYAELPQKVLCRETAERAAVRQHSISLLRNREAPVTDNIRSIGKYLCNITPVSADFGKSIRLMEALSELYYEISPSIKSYCDTADKLLCRCEERVYRKLKSRLLQNFPNLNLFFEQLLINHLFYEKFPYADATFDDAYVSLCGLYGFMIALAVGNTEKLTDTAALTDLYQALFRVVEHTRFDHNVEIVMRDYDFFTPEIASTLLTL